MSGIVVNSKSFDGLETVARQKNAKGCFLNRGRHLKEKQIMQWLNNHNEDDFDFGEFATVQLQVAPQQDSCDSDCKDTLCKAEAKIAGENEIIAACAQLVSDLPSSFREDLRLDAELIVKMCRNLCPTVPWITLRLEIVQYNACWRWHQDGYVGRTIVSYVGPGTCTVEDQDVDWKIFEQTMQDEKNDRCVPQERIKQMQTNSVLLMKGDSWPKICGNGLMHKSPSVYGNQPPKRLLLKVDLNIFRPSLGMDEDGDSDEDAEEEENSDKDDPIHGSDARTLVKRLATSAGFKSAKAWKVRRR